MAKTRKRPGRYTRNTRETGADLSFVGTALDDAVAAIQRRARDLPISSAAERRVVRSAVLGLKLLAKTTQLHCGPRWFFLAR